MAAVQLECSLKGLLECDDKQTETMEIVNDPLPEHIVEDARNARGNIQTKNARYRSAVCDYLGLGFRAYERNILTVCDVHQHDKR